MKKVILLIHFLFISATCAKELDISIAAEIYLSRLHNTIATVKLEDTKSCGHLKSTLYNDSIDQVIINYVYDKNCVDKHSLNMKEQSLFLAQVLGVVNRPQTNKKIGYIQSIQTSMVLSNFKIFKDVRERLNNKYVLFVSVIGEGDKYYFIVKPSGEMLEKKDKFILRYEELVE